MQVAVLGPVVATKASEVVALGGPKDRAVLAMLALATPHHVSEAEILFGLWGEDPPPSGARAVRNQLFRLRRALRDAGIDAEVIATRPGGYQLMVEPDAIDVRRAEALAQAGRVALAQGDPRRASIALHEALALWQGTPLSNVAELPFAAPVVIHLCELRLQVQEDCFDADLACGSHHELIAELTTAVHEHPLRERRWCQLMLALHRAGHQVEALRCFQDLRTHLDEELGLLPGADAVDLERAIAIGDPSLQLQHRSPAAQITRRRPDLPRPRTRFLGRDEDRAELPKLIDATACVSIVGPGGVGKTRLALEVAATCAATRRDGAVFVDLGAVEEAALVAQAVAQAVGVEDREGQSLLDRTLERLQGADHLIVLDNCEHVIEAAATIAETIVERCDAVNVLATSRQALRIDGELVWRLAPLSVPDLDGELDARTIGSSYGVQLFTDRAGLARPGFVLDDATAPAVARIVAQLDGIPLAIELAAAGVGDVEVAELADRLVELFSALPPGRRTAPERQRTLWATIEWSVERLDRNDQELLAGLAAFTADFAVSAAAAVCTKDGEVAAVAAALVVLEERSLIHPVPVDDDTEPRYRLLDCVREYGRVRLSEGVGDVAGVTARLVDWATALTVANGRALDFGDDLPAARALDRDYPNVRGALRAAIARPDPEAALDLLGGAGPYWHLRSLRGEARTWAEAALALPGIAAALDERPDAHLALEFTADIGDFPTRVLHAERAIAAAARVGDEVARATALASLGLATRERGRPDDARRHLDAALDAARSGGDAGVLACVLERRAEVQYQDGEPDDAAAALEEATGIYRGLRNRRGELWCLATIGGRAVLDEDLTSALRSFERGLELAVELGYDHGEGWMRTALGVAHLALGDPDASFAFCTAARDIQHRTGDTLNIGWSTSGLERVLLARGDGPGVLATIDESRQQGRRAQESAAAPGSLLRRLAIAAAALGRDEVAGPLLAMWEGLDDQGPIGLVEQRDLEWLRERLTGTVGADRAGDPQELIDWAFAELTEAVGTGATLIPPPLPG